MSLIVGNLFITASVVKTVCFSEIVSSLKKHSKIILGGISEEEKKVNDDVLTNGGRILSKNILKDKREIYVITDKDRTMTTVLFPDEYIDC